MGMQRLSCLMSLPEIPTRCPNLAQGFDTHMREHSNCSMWEQGGCEGQKGETEAHSFPQKKAPTFSTMISLRSLTTILRSLFYGLPGSSVAICPSCSRKNLLYFLLTSTFPKRESWRCRSS